MDEAKSADPNACWWVKADGVDVIKGLGESTRGVWCGDVDLNDGKLNALQSLFSERLKFVKAIGLGTRKEITIIISDLQQAADQAKRDKEYVVHGK